VPDVAADADHRTAMALEFSGPPNTALAVNTCM
jgi:hypothetical protein